ncbi:hypothetical protein FNV43_RR01709 [Rhamnella rubrinervis]|uniref:F-box domain-containing protein n=1 Tax=Rhamnella rubrinervis TaxID=2594499 RepID=A0A8K0HQ46_9ROSA|nr:hypothetical protein FNV43_RR01709 [Rhamnella rubrinervis]
MATKREKGMVDNETDTICEDRISQLPESLIHYIFSFLPAIYIVRMSLASKSWRRMWVSTPFLCFENFKYITSPNKAYNEDRVLNFVGKYLTCRKLYMQVPETSISRFKFDTSYTFARSAAKQIDDWLSFVVQSKVQELDLHVRDYCLSQCVLNSSSLTVLKLSKLKLEVSSLSTLPSLKVLSLMHVKSDAKSLRKVISGCPIIRELLLSGYDLGDLDFTVSETLRNLSLECAHLKDQWLNCLISGLPQLESLKVECYELRKISVRSHSLKYFYFRSLSSIRAALSTPNLVFLDIANVDTDSIISVEAPNLIEAKLKLNVARLCETSFLALMHLLSKLSCLRQLTLVVPWEEVLIFPKGIRKKWPSPLPNLKHLKRAGTYNHGNKRVKRDCGEELDNQPNNMAEDRISHLPEPLIHHIFSFLPTIFIVRMSLLSKRWRWIWVSNPFLYFGDFDYKITFPDKVNKRDMVLKFVGNYLRSRKLYMQVPETSVTSFKFGTCYKFTHSATRRMDGWLNFCVQRRVKELDLRFKNYCLPKFVLNSSSLTVLKLRELKLEAPSLSILPSLKVLSLSVECDAKSLQNLISGCPIIEELYLRGHGKRELDFTVSETLRNLSLELVRLTDQWLNALISGLPLLERLSLQWIELKKFSIRSHSLKYFCFKSFSYFNEVAFSMPNLVCLHLSCVPNIIISVEAPNLLEANLIFEDCYLNQGLYLALVHLLSNLNCSKKMTLTTRDERVRITIA